MKRCRNGHDMTAENTAWRGTMPRCLTCKRDRDKKRRARKRVTNRRTGPVEATVLAVWTRAGHRCERCGKHLLYEYRGWLWSVQHRLARAMGGTSDPKANDPANLGILCGSATTPGGCHNLVENEDRARGVEEGWVLRHPTDPESAPVLIFDAGWVLLRSDHYEPVAA